MRVTVIGAGHVGLVTAVCLASVGHDVVAEDDDLAKVELLRRGNAWFYEPGLEDLLREGMAAGRLRFTSDAAEAVRHGEGIFITVGTPSRSDRRPHLAFVEKVAREAPPGAVYEVASNPEFLREGTAVADTLGPDRIVVGAESERAVAMLRRLSPTIIE